jgi:beta-N-acetylhexosaminidase
VDLEGGSVDRLRDALAPMPSAQAVANCDARHRPDKSQRVRNIFAAEHGALVAQAVKAFGFNTTLAPVLDLGLPDSASVMGTRTAAPSAEGVTDYAEGFLAGLASYGVIGCAKHFPGLGGGTRDSHLETPAILRNSDEIWREDLAPYRNLRDTLPMVMVNHAAYPATMGKSLPASVSHYWMTTVLRKRIGYKGIIFSDDLEMGGILKCMSIEEAVISAVRAGMDMMEICHSPELILRAYEALVSEAEKSKSFATLLVARAKRNSRLRAKWFSSPISPQLSTRQLEALRARILRFGETIAKCQSTQEAEWS